MPDTAPPASGRDLARQALAAYKAKASNSPAQSQTKTTRRRTGVSRTGRDPVALDSLLGRLSAEQGWETGLGGGSILEQWPALCPQYDGHVEAVHYDPEQRRLDLRPGSDAYAAQLRLLGGQLARQINDKVGRPVVQRIRILPTASLGRTPAQAANSPAAVAAPGPPAAVRRDPPPGYHRAAALAREHKPDPLQFANPHIKAAIEASDRALADPRNREPEHLHAEAVAEAERLAALEPTDPLVAAVRAARAVARREREGRMPQPVFGLA